jgi:septation ring formation regulator EzrA
MLQFCHLALRTSAEQGVLTEQRKNLDAIQSTAGDIRALVDKLPPEEKQKAREIIGQMNVALQKQGKIVGDYLTRSDEQQRALKEHNDAVEKGLTSLTSDLDALKSLPVALKDLDDGIKRVDGKVGADDASLKALAAQLADVDGKVQKLLARPAYEPPKALAAAGKATPAAPGKGTSAGAATKAAGEVSVARKPGGSASGSASASAAVTAAAADLGTAAP